MVELGTNEDVFHVIRAEDMEALKASVTKIISTLTETPVMDITTQIELNRVAMQLYADLFNPNFIYRGSELYST